MKRIIVLLIAIIMVVPVFFLLKGSKPPHEPIKRKQITKTRNPVILLIIDSLMTEPLQQAVNSGRAPAFQFLMEHGQLYPNMVSSYPTMSVTIDSTLLTGTYADQHRVPGLVWYDKKANRLINYGSAKGEVFKLGVKQVAEDNLYHLNHTHLSRKVKTIHEVLDKKGLQSASVNALVYRGNEERTLHFPKISSLLNVTPEKIHIKTPTLFSYGMLSRYNPENNKHTAPWDVFGFNDKFSAREIKYMIEEGKLPAFTISYFPELDKRVHEKGPNNSIEGIEKADKQLQEILNAYPSWKDALVSATWVVMGDSGQAVVGADKDKSMIRLNEMLDTYKVHRVTEPVKDDDQIVLAHNERMAFIYVFDQKVGMDEVANKLQQDKRIGFAAWKQNASVHVIANGHSEPLVFHPNGNLKDTYGQKWEVTGDYTILDLTVSNGNISYGEYPDALARLYSSFHSHAGNYLIVDAKPGYEFAGEGTPTHPGGAAHGSLHKSDSLVPMIVAGSDAKPRHQRIVDLFDWLVDLSTRS